MARTLQLLRRFAAPGTPAPLASLQGAALAMLPAAGVAAWRGLRGSAPRLGFGSHVSDNDPTILEREKLRNLQTPNTVLDVPDMPGWNQELASDSEAAVKADQSPVETTEELQTFSVKRVFKNRMNAHEAITPKPPTESSASEQTAQ